MDARTRLIQAMQALDPVRTSSEGASNWYVTPPDGGIHQRVLRGFGRDPSAHMLVLGGIGTGKTTEQLRAKALIEERRLARAWHTPIDDYFDMRDVREGRLVTLAGLAMLAVLRDRGELITGKLRDAALVLHGMIRSDRAVTAPLVMVEFARQHRLSPPTVGAADLAHQIDVLLQHWREGRSAQDGIVLLVDALDRYRFESFLTATSADLPLLRAFGVGVAIVGNIDWRSAITLDHRDPFHDLWVAPSLDASAKSDADFLREVLSRRVPDLFTAEIADQIVDASGGRLRDLLRLALHVVYETLDAGEEIPSAPACARAIETTRLGRLSMLRPTELEALNALAQGIQPDANVGDLLVARGCAIFRGGAYAPHPAMRERSTRPEAA